MSLLSTRLRIAISPAHVAVADRGGCRERQLSGQGLDAVLAALAELVQGRGGQRQAEVTLSHQIAPVWLLPAAPVRLSWQETRGWVRDRLHAQFGDLVDRWQFAWESVPRGEPILVSGIDAQWLAGLQEGLGSQGIRPERVSPWLVAACNRHRRLLGKGSCWLALAESDRLTLAGFERGQLQTLRSSLVADAPAANLAAMLERETLLGEGPSSRRVWLQALHVQGDWRGNTAGLEVRELSPASEGLAMMMEA